ncbi:hypothetical protein THOG11_50190 [Vibrio harveyi]|nr:hypothetical protein TH15OA1_500041 [Vibrio harveyi]CAH1580626.1 hypothetical protein THOG11_50190 [Vibrio harveyi]CAH1593051.1 hypothetical protein THOD04_40207 [Vibrio owensii]
MLLTLVFLTLVKQWLIKHYSLDPKQKNFPTKPRNCVRLIE